MPRPSTVLVIFVVAMNAFAFAMIGMGVDDTMGLDGNIESSGNIQDDPNFDGGEGSDEVTLPTGSGAGGTLFGMYNVLGSGLESVFATIFPALKLMARAGVPSELVNAGGTLMGFIIGFDVLSFIRGWDL